MKNFFVFFSSICILTTGPCLAQHDRNKAFSPALNVGNGLRAEYFNGRDFQEKVHSRIDEEIDFFYRTASPAPGVYRENYSIRWSGSLYAPVTGTYKIIVRVDDGVRLWVNGKKILDKWHLQKAITHSCQVDLKAGEFYSLKIEYFNGPTYGIIQLMWEVPEDNPGSFFGLTSEPTREIIPRNYLYGELEEEEGARVAREKKKKSSLTVAEKNAEVKPPETGVAPVAEKEEVFENLSPGAVVTFKNVRFEQGKYLLLEGSNTELEKLLRTMLRYPALRIRIDGHTDNVGDPNLNQSLSFFRAKVVETYLVEKGVDVSRIEVNGYGSSRPLADNATEEGRAKNRRVEFVVK